MARTEYFDALETRSFEEREIALAAALEVQVRMPRRMRHFLLNG